MFDGGYHPDSKFDKICDFIDGFPLTQIGNLFKKLFKKLDKNEIMTKHMYERILRTVAILLLKSFIIGWFICAILLSIKH